MVRVSRWRSRSDGDVEAERTRRGQRAHVEALAAVARIGGVLGVVVREARPREQVPTDERRLLCDTRTFVDRRWGTSQLKRTSRSLANPVLKMPASLIG